MRKTVVLLLLLAVVLASSAAEALTVTETGNATTLVNTILGPGMTATGTPTFIGNSQAAGTFTGGLASGISIERGIILSSGKVSSAPGPNSSESTSWSFSGAGDTSLNALVPGGYETFDACGVEFDFTVTPAPGVSNDLAFNFVFASEEYLEFVGSVFNDVFGFFVDGTNIAHVPGTTTPISVNTVNSTSNAAYYVNNPAGSGAYALEYDGFTRVITARLTGISSGTHHMKIVVADTSDYIYDAAVFLQGGSMAVGPTTPWTGATDLSGGWKWLPWFGYFSDAGNGWIYHSEHHWMYAIGSPDNIWFWTADMGWLWSNSVTYPYLYRNSNQHWLWYLQGSSGPRWFYDLTAGVWESH